MKPLLVIINLMTAILFFTLIYSAINIDISMPTEKGISYSLDSSDLIVNFPIDIKNNGIYPIENLNIDVSILNKSSKVFEHSFVIKEIRAFHIFSKMFSFKINLIELYKKLGNYYIFHGGTFKMNVSIHARYWVLAYFNAFYQREFEFTPLIYRCQFYYDEMDFGNGEISVPYFISKLPVNLNATLGINIMDSRGIIAHGKNKIVFDKKSYITLKTNNNYDYLLTNSEMWKIKYTINIDGFVIKRSANYEWSALLTDIKFSEEKDKNLTLYLQFKNNRNKNLNLEIDEIINHNGEFENKTINATVNGGIFKIPLVSLSDGDYQIYITIIEKNMNMKYTMQYSVGEEDE